MKSVGRGGTIRRDATFSDGAGNLVDPTTPRVDILDPSSLAVVTDAAPVRDALGLYHYDFTPAVDAPLGVWVDHWTGVINGAAVSGDDFFEVVGAGSIGFDGSSAFASPDELAVLLQRTLTPEEAASAALVLDIASATIRTFTRQTLSRATTTARLLVSSSSLVLPERPVISVDSVVYDRRVLAADLDYSVAGNTLRLAHGFDRYGPGYVDVTYTHGFDPIRDDIKGICLEMARSAVVEPAGNVKAESLGSYSITFDPGAAAILSKSQQERLRPYRPVITSVPIAAASA
jgi:hypothetical protein